ncbi:MAG: hypothetical protein IKP75_08795 [Oscillospiraceae bacterium]|nr:hypothetical protein [Oscillospiraceae bacterium]
MAIISVQFAAGPKVRAAIFIMDSRYTMVPYLSVPKVLSQKGYGKLSHGIHEHDADDAEHRIPEELFNVVFYIHNYHKSLTA